MEVSAMNIREQVEARAKELGATVRVVVDTDLRLEVEVEAPHKHIFQGLELHETHTAWDKRYEYSRDEAWALLLEDMQAGCEDCDIVDCEWCGHNAEATLAEAEFKKDDLQGVEVIEMPQEAMIMMDHTQKIFDEQLETQRDEDREARRFARGND